ncbi:MAG: tyrosine-type recombinase/integrase, partial [Holophaga sp.]|nr:tyrosine-type recombinase/integrase [Holophaga sp.]
MEAKRKNITDSFVREMDVRESKYVYWDPKLTGFGAQVTPNGVKSYVFKYIRNGKQGWVTIGKTSAWKADAARERAREMRKQLDQGLDPKQRIEAEKQAPTVSELADRYLEEHADLHNKKRSAKEARALVEKIIKPNLGEMRAKDVNREHVEKLLRDLKNTPTRANRVRSALSKMFNLAEQWNLRDDFSNPCHHVKPYKEAKRERYLNRLELEALGLELDSREAAEPYCVAAIRLLIFTGARLSEILELTWNRVDMERRVLVIDAHKTDKSGNKFIPINPPVLLALGYVLDENGEIQADSKGNPKRKEGAIIRLLSNPYVLPGDKSGEHLTHIHKCWDDMRTSAGVRLKETIESEGGELAEAVDLSDVRIHDLRHCFASVGAGAGISLPIIGKLLGHTQAATTQRYAHLAASPLQAASEDISGRLAEALIINSTLTTLDLCSNHVGDDGAGQLAETLTTNSTLTTLDLSFNQV